MHLRLNVLEQLPVKDRDTDGIDEGHDSGVYLEKFVRRFSTIDTVVDL